MNQNKKNLNLYDDELLAELDKAFVITATRPKGFGVTVREFMAARDVSESSARRILSGAVARLGWAKKWMHLSEGHAAWVYYKP